MRLISFIVLLLVAVTTNYSQNLQDYYLDKMEGYQYSKHFDSVQFYFSKSLKIATANNDSASKFYAYNYLSNAHEHHRRYDSTLYYIDICKKLVPSTKKSLFTFALAREAYTYELLENYELSSKRYLEVYELAKKEGDYPAMVTSLLNGAIIYNDAKLYDKAEKLFKDALSIIPENDSFGTYDFALTYYSETLLTREKYDTANILIDKLLHNYSIIEDTMSISKIWHLKSEYLWSQNNFDSSLICEKISLKQYQNRADPVYVSQISASLGNKYFELQQYDSAEKYLSMVDNIEQLDNTSSKKLFDNLNSIYLLRNDYSKAVASQKKYIDYLETSKANQSNIDGIKLRLQYDEDKKNIEIIQANNAATLEKKKNEFYFSLSLALLGIVLVVIIFIFLFIRKNKKLKKAIDHNQTLMQELHHRVKNNLQIISSLLNLQSNATKDPETTAAIKEGQNRVKSIALIHQKLYQNNGITEVEMSEYIIDLSTYLNKAFSRKDLKVDIHHDIKKLVLDIDTAVPIGLILNELISNSFKHAFSNQSSGEITIGLNYSATKRNVIELKYADNGPGINEDINIEKSTSLGLKLIYMLTKQLDGEVEIKKGPKSKFTFILANTELRKNAQ